MITTFKTSFFRVLPAQRIKFVWMIKEMWTTDIQKIGPKSAQFTGRAHKKELVAVGRRMARNENQ